MRKSILIIVSILITASLACGLFTPKSQSVENLATPEISEDAAQQLVDNLKAAKDQLDANLPVDLVITEAQLTSFVVLKLNEQGVTNVQDPVIYLRDGKVVSVATYNEGGNSLKMEVDLAFTVTDGALSITLERLKLNGFTAPGLMLTQAQKVISEQIEPAFRDEVTQGMYINTLSIENGTLHLTGQKP